MDIKYLVSLSSQLNKAQKRVTSAQLRWNHLVLLDDGMQSSDSNNEGDGGNKEYQFDIVILVLFVTRCDIW